MSVHTSLPGSSIKRTRRKGWKRVSSGDEDDAPRRRVAACVSRLLRLICCLLGSVLASAVILVALLLTLGSDPELMPQAETAADDDATPRTQQEPAPAMRPALEPTPAPVTPAATSTPTPPPPAAEVARPAPAEPEASPTAAVPEPEQEDEHADQDGDEHEDERREAEAEQGEPASEECLACFNAARRHAKKRGASHAEARAHAVERAPACGECAWPPDPPWPPVAPPPSNPSPAPPPPPPGPPCPTRPRTTATVTPPEVFRADGPRKHTFMMYRAVASDGEDYHMENVNLASLEGVLAYVHHEVICNGGCPERKFKINHIQRFKVTMRSTWAAYDACATDPGSCEYSPEPWGARSVAEGSPGHQFMRFVAFDQGKRAWDPPGLPSVGCSTHEIKHTFYNHAYGEHATYYSLPGRCSRRTWKEAKWDDACQRDEPGGECSSAKQLDEENPKCTWHAERLGEVWIDELTGILDRREFCHAGGREWWSDEEVDVCASGFCPRCDPCKNSQCMLTTKRPGDGRGRDPQPRVCQQPAGCQWGDRQYAGSTGGVWHEFVKGGRACFWDGRDDHQRNAERVAALEGLFARKYPSVRPAHIRGPACGW